jgi:hypothetical protein
MMDESEGGRFLMKRCDAEWGRSRRLGEGKPSRAKEGVRVREFLGPVWEGRGSVGRPSLIGGFRTDVLGCPYNQAHVLSSSFDGVRMMIRRDTRFGNHCILVDDRALLFQEHWLSSFKCPIVMLLIGDDVTLGG